MSEHFERRFTSLNGSYTEDVTDGFEESTFPSTFIVSFSRMCFKLARRGGGWGWVGSPPVGATLSLDKTSTFFDGWPPNATKNTPPLELSVIKALGSGMSSFAVRKDQVRGDPQWSTKKEVFNLK